MSAETDVINTSLTEWAVQCVTRDGNLYTGRPMTSRKDAQESGERLTRISVAEWWLVTRRRVVTVETSPWTRDVPPGTDATP
jgi:hypothetical protein